jgi:hypothetical protein
VFLGGTQSALNYEPDCSRYDAIRVDRLHLCDATKDVYPSLPVVLLLSLQYVQKAVDGAASAEGISKVDAELTALKHKVAGELIGARYDYGDMPRCSVRVLTFA